MRIAIGARASGLLLAVTATLLLGACREDYTTPTHVATSGRALRQPDVPTATGTSPATASAPAPSSTNATISWTPPTQSTNGSALGPLSGFKIYYGTASQQYTTTISVSNPGLTAYVIDGLEVGTTYYFAVTAVTAAGIESSFSPEVSATIS